MDKTNHNAHHSSRHRLVACQHCPVQSSAVGAAVVVVVMANAGAAVSAPPAVSVVAAAAPAAVVVEDYSLGCDVRFVTIGRFENLGGGCLKSGGKLF